MTRLSAPIKASMKKTATALTLACSLLSSHGAFLKRRQPIILMSAFKQYYSKNVTGQDCKAKA